MHMETADLLRKAFAEVEAFLFSKTKDGLCI